MPPPTGVVSGPLIAILYVLTASSVSLGSHSPVRSLAFSPARISNQTRRRAAAKRFLHGRIEHANAGAPDVGPGAVAFDERNDRIVGHDQLSLLACERRAINRRRQVRELWHVPSLLECCVRSPAARRCAVRASPRHRYRMFTDACGKVCGKVGACGPVRRLLRHVTAVCTMLGQSASPPCRSCRPGPNVRLYLNRFVTRRGLPDLHFSRTHSPERLR